MKNKILLVASCLVVFNCGSDPEETIPQVSSIYELGECRADREGEQALVTSDGENYKCANGRWSHSSEDADASEENVSEGEGLFKDPRDGRVYKTVKLGSRVWMAENLKYAFNDGVQSFCYLDREEYCDFLGRLYTWSGAMAMTPKYDSTYDVKLTLPHQGICPDGWHVSTMEDWEDLVDYVDAHNGNESVALSLMSDEGWYFEDYNGLMPSFTVKNYDFNRSNRNKFGFNLMSGVRYLNTYTGVGDSSLTWVASEDFQIEHIYAAARWPFLGYSYCYGYDAALYKNCVDASGNPASTLEQRAPHQKGMGKPVRCVSDKYDRAAKGTVVPKATAMGESSINAVSQTLLDERDGTVYRVVKIGNQIWMAENLKYKTEGGNADDLEGSLCLGNKAENCDVQGRLYNWNAAMDIPQEYESARWLKIDYPRQGICPGGWHLPTDDEWQKLVNYVIADVGEDNLMASLCVKSEDSDYDEEQLQLADKYGFSVGCDRYRDDGVTSAEYDVLMQSVRDRGYLYYWTATQTFEPLAREFSRKGPAHSVGQFGKITYAPVRCLKD